MTSRPSPSPLILCPLEFERDHLRRAGLGGAFDIAVSGPGAACIHAWVARHGGNQPIILAGLAGGLSRHVHTGEAYIISSVVTATGDRLTPSLAFDARDVVSATISSPSASLTTSEAKRIWHEELATDLADLESEAFARAMGAAGRPWAIVRGVSDGPNDTLPPGIDDWVDEQGRVRRAVVALAVLKNPGMLAATRRLGTRAKRAMAAVARVLRDLAESCDASTL